MALNRRAIVTPSFYRLVVQFRPGDFYVFVGIAPSDFRWYLRFYLDPDADEEERSGRFDLTLPPELVARYREEVVTRLGLAMHEQEAETYYASLQA